jgi:hypothetical protein
MGRFTHFLFLSGVLTFSACSSGRYLAGEADQKQEKVSALFSEPRFTARCFSVVEPEPNQFINIDLASIESAKIIQTLDDCARFSEKSRAAVGNYVSTMSHVASSGMKPIDRFEFNPSHWPVEFHFNNKIYHIYQGKVLSVENN